LPPERSRRRTPVPAALALFLVLIPAAAAAGGTIDDLLAAGQVREARDLLEQRYRDDPSGSRTTEVLARVRAWTGDYPGALRLYDTILLERPRDPEIRVERARVLAWSGRYREAEREALDVVGTDPGFDQAWVLLADARLWEGDPEGARGAAQEGMSRVPESPALLAWMAASDYRRGRVGDARDRLSQAVALEPSLRERIDPALYSLFVVESRFVYEDVSPLGPWRDMALSLDWRPRGPWAARGEMERIDRFGLEELSVAGSVTRAAGDWRLVGSVRGAPNAEILPRWGVSAGASWTASPGWRVEGGAQRNRYRSGSTMRLDAGLLRTWGAVWETGYRLTWTRDVFGAGDVTQTLTGSWIPSPFAALRLDLFRGSDVTRSAAGADITTDITTGLALAGRVPVARGWGLRLSAAATAQKRSYERRSLGLGVVHLF